MTFKARIKQLDMASAISSTVAGSLVVPCYDEAGHAYSGSIQMTTTVTANGSNKTFTDTDVNTTTDIVTVTSHGFTTGQIVTLTTSSTLPSPLLVATSYYIISVSANTLKFASSADNAIAGTAIDLTTAGGVAATQTIIPTAVGYSLFLDGSNDGTNYVPFFSLETLTTSQSFAWMLDGINAPNFRYIKFRKAITGGVVAVVAYLELLGETA